MSADRAQRIFHILRRQFRRAVTLCFLKGHVVHRQDAGKFSIVTVDHGQPPNPLLLHNLKGLVDFGLGRATVSLARNHFVNADTAWSAVLPGCAGAKQRVPIPAR